MRKSVQAGFTLVEILIVLGLSGLMLLLLLHQHSANSATQFSGGIDSLRNNMVELRNEAMSTTNDDPGATGAHDNDIVWGKAVELTGGTETTSTVVATISGNVVTSVTIKDSQTITLPWSITTGQHERVAFLRDPGTGGLQLYHPTALDSSPGSYVLATSPIVVNYHNIDGHVGSITFDPNAQAVTRAITQ